MNVESFVSWMAVAAMFLLVVGLLVIASFSFEIITFSNAGQKFISTNGNCEMEFTETPAWDVNYGGYWNCKELLEVRQ